MTSSGRASELERSNRLYAALSHVNQSIVWARSRDDLFARICDSLVEHGRFRLAWVGWHDEARHELACVAAAGIVAYASEIVVATDDRPEGRGPAGTAFREQRTYVCRDMERDPAALPWREAARRHGIRACACVPFRVGGEVVGTLNVYAAESFFFEPRGIALLEEAATDISFALDNLSREEERKRSDAAAERDRRFVTSVIDSQPGILYLYDEEGRFLRWNHNFEHVSGYSADEIRTMVPLQFFEGSDRALLESRIREVFTIGEARVEADFVTKTGERIPYFFTGKRITFDGKVCLVGVGIDVSERKRAELALRDLNESLERKVAERTKDLEAAVLRAEDADHTKSAFLATMSHELRTPLNSILGFTGILVQGLAGPLNGEQSKQLGMVQTSARHLLELINDVLDISRIEAGQLEVHPILQKAPFIVYTATYTEPRDEMLAKNLGADAFIVKPAEPEVILASLRTVQQRSHDASPAPAVLMPVGTERDRLEEYSQALIRKLEEKTATLEAMNRSLEADIAARAKAEAARDRAEREASERASLLDALVASIPDSVTHVDRDGTILLVNHRLRGMREGQVGQSWFETGAPEQRDLMQTSLEEALTRGAPASFESTSRDESGAAVTMWTTIGPIVRDGKTAGAVVIARDISERKQTEAQLIVSDRMASVGILAAGVAHEINNPLASVTANLSLAEEELSTLAQRLPIPPDLLEEIRDARNGTERVRLIVRDLKIFSRSEDEKRGPVDVEQVLDSTLRMAWNELRHRAKLVKRYGKVPPVLANESRLGQVLLNLVVNAAQSIQEGNYAKNEVRVETKHEPATSRVWVSIADTGTGIPPEIQRRLFTPFVTTKPVGVGTGLGLSICHRIVTSLGGTIEFSSAVGVGSTFRIALPTADLSSPAPLASVRPEAERGARGRVLVVDDDIMITHSVRRLLSSEHDVVAAHGAEQAMELLRSGERFDVILSDLMMPQVTGMDLYAWLMKLDPEQASRVVFMTGGAFTPSARAFLDEVESERFEKPFDVRALRALVARWVRARPRAR